MNKKALIILIILFFLNVFVLIGVLVKSPEYLEVVYFDVGQGDSIFIETPEGHQILLDGGPDDSVLSGLEKEMFPLDSTIDLIVLSHPDSDHITGLLEVLKRYQVENVIWTGVLKDSPEVSEWKELLENEGSNIFIADNSLNVSLGDVSLDVLYPFDSLEGKEVDNTNNSSVVLKLVYGETSFLFPGDIYEEVEMELLKKDVDVSADVLKAAHHGSRTSTSEEFLYNVYPNAVVISLGRDNTYGHPHPEVLELLEKYGISIFRTDLSGNIKLLSDKNKIYGVSNI